MTGSSVVGIMSVLLIVGLGATILLRQPAETMINIPDALSSSLTPPTGGYELVPPVGYELFGQIDFDAPTTWIKAIGPSSPVASEGPGAPHSFITVVPLPVVGGEEVLKEHLTTDPATYGQVVESGERRYLIYGRADDRAEIELAIASFKIN